MKSVNWKKELNQVWKGKESATMPRSSVLDKVKQGQDEFNEGRKKKRDEWVRVNVMQCCCVMNRHKNRETVWADFYLQRSAQGQEDSISENNVSLRWRRVMAVLKTSSVGNKMHDIIVLHSTCRRISIWPLPSIFCQSLQYTGPVCRMSQRKGRETEQQPSRARSDHQISCCLFSLHAAHRPRYLFKLPLIQFSWGLPLILRWLVKHWLRAWCCFASSWVSCFISCLFVF